MSTFEELSVCTIAGGNAIKQVDYQLEQAIQNCLDPNTIATAKRSITLKITLKPTNDRTTAELEFSVESKLPCDAPGVDTVQIARQHRRGYVPTQQLSMDELVNKENEENEKIDPETGEVIPLERKES